MARLAVLFPARHDQADRPMFTSCCSLVSVLV
jgi:hypothetical protein